MKCLGLVAMEAHKVRTGFFPGLVSRIILRTMHLNGTLLRFSLVRGRGFGRKDMFQS